MNILDLKSLDRTLGEYKYIRPNKKGFSRFYLINCNFTNKKIFNQLGQKGIIEEIKIGNSSGSSNIFLAYIIINIIGLKKIISDSKSIKIDFSNGMIYNHNNFLIYKFTPRQKSIISELFGSRKKLGTNSENLIRIIDNINNNNISDKSKESLKKFIQRLNSKLRELGISDFIRVRYKKGEDTYILEGNYFK